MRLAQFALKHGPWHGAEAAAKHLQHVFGRLHGFERKKGELVERLHQKLERGIEHKVLEVAVFNYLQGTLGVRLFQDRDAPLFLVDVHVHDNELRAFGRVLETVLGRAQHRLAAAHCTKSTTNSPQKSKILGHTYKPK